MDDPPPADGPRKRRGGKASKPLDTTGLRDLALAYMARFATSTARLERYLKRKLRERGWEDAEGREPDIASLVERYAGLGYVDDAAFARSKADGLLRRGYGARRVRQVLGQDGIAENLRDQMAPGEHAARTAALMLARKRRFGPFATEPVAPEKREKQIAAMLRAGHSFEHARALIDMGSEGVALEWLDEVDDEAMD